jgi:Flp pilus assembly protein TadG
MPMLTRGGGRFIRPRTANERGAGRSRGQSLVEFTLILPVFLLILMFAIDFGRAFLDRGLEREPPSLRMGEDGRPDPRLTG